MEIVMDKIYGYLTEYWLQVVGAVLIFVIGRWLAKAISKLIGIETQRLPGGNSKHRI